MINNTGYKVSADGATDAYKIGMSQLHELNIDGHHIVIANSYSNFTPRKNAFMQFSELSDQKIVVYGTRDTFQSVVNLWNSTFFNVDHETAMKRLHRRTKNVFGSITEHAKYLADMSRLHVLGYLPIEVRAIDEGTRYPIGLPVFTVEATVDGFGWLVNYIETISSGYIWPMINTATKVEQFYLQAKHYGEISAPKEIVDRWLPICVHEFGMRGYRGLEDQIRTSSASSLFFLGSDTSGVIDFFEDAYDADADAEPIAISVRATEHADISRMLSLFRHLAQEHLDEGTLFRGVNPQEVLDDTEYFVLDWFISNSSGILSYVSDTENYYRLINVYAAKLAEKIRNRSPNEDGQPAVLVFRPDSSRHRPLNVICGYEIIEEKNLDLVGDMVQFRHSCDDTVVVKLHGGEYHLAYEDENLHGMYALGEKISREEAEGSLVSLWNTFGGTVLDTQSGPMKFIDPCVGLIYGEAISQQHQKEIYERMVYMGFSVTNLLIGKGSYASLENSTRDLLSMSYKQTFSEAIIDGKRVNLEQQKTPMGDVSKKSAKGLLRVERVGEEWVLHQNQTREQANQGELTLLLRDGHMVKRQSLSNIKNVYASATITRKVL